MAIESIQHQQLDRITQNSALRKAAYSPSPPSLSADESEMIQKKFSQTKPITTYSMQGNTEKSSFFSRGLNVDRLA